MTKKRNIWDLLCLLVCFFGFGCGGREVKTPVVSSLPNTQISGFDEGGELGSCKMADGTCRNFSYQNVNSEQELVPVKAYLTDTLCHGVGDVYDPSGRCDFKSPQYIAFCAYHPSSLTLTNRLKPLKIIHA